jgi:hypothetical protein
MFFLLTGIDPQDNPLLIFDFTKSPGPKEINANLTDGIDGIIRKSVEYRLEARYTAAEMKSALENHLMTLGPDTSEEELVETDSEQEQILREELEVIDLYIEQGYFGIARESLESLEKQFPDDDSIKRYFIKLETVQSLTPDTSTDTSTE